MIIFIVVEGVENRVILYIVGVVIIIISFGERNLVMFIKSVFVIWFGIFSFRNVFDRNKNVSL